MKAKNIFILILAAMVIAACGGKTNVINKPSQQGIDYEQYKGTSSYQSYDDYMPEDEDFVGESRTGARSAYGDAVVVMASKKISLGRKATTDGELKLFQNSLDKAYLNAKKTYMPIGFTYSMSPAGSVNPLSDMDVQCILSEESSADIGQKTCDLFFKSLRSEYAIALQEYNAAKGL
ncbi:hypothetical protein Dip510_002103 [Elusimicrobium posterum]|uniref:hypothetical protein n=1 Tax=Elusimicrobium posterum TaxID=3116653 RepID=UPI003C73E9BC